ncbi:type ISP restriction/modification enzyme [Motilibacter rhizosphaerae]|nr:type ISP restriction/modification enzyme [Motilibacter rhizosphaerae]
MPDTLVYDAHTRASLLVGESRIAPVPPAVVQYQVSGTNVLRKWFGYRRATRPQTRGPRSPLDDIRPTSWPSAYTTDLLDVLVLLTDLETDQQVLLDLVLESPRLTQRDLTEAGVLPVSDAARIPASAGAADAANRPGAARLRASSTLRGRAASGRAAAAAVAAAGMTTAGPGDASAGRRRGPSADSSGSCG